jgi:PAS domain S-box-containing protein
LVFYLQPLAPAPVSIKTMIRFLNNTWDNISNAGTQPSQSPRERNGIILLNRAWLILLLLQIGCLAQNIVLGMVLSSVMTTAYIGGLALIHVLIRLGHINAGKIWAIVVINLNTALMAVFLGEQTHLIDFLMLTALMPLYFFEIKNYKLIFWGILASIIPMSIYHFAAPMLTKYALPLETQLNIYQTTNWVKQFCLVLLLYLIYNKNAAYEKEVSEKESELSGQKKLYERILDQIPMDIITYNHDLNFTYVNSAAVKNAGTRQWMIGKNNSAFFKEYNLDPTEGARREKILYEALAKKETVEKEETIFAKNNTIKHVMNGVSPVYNSAGDELLTLICYSIDITHLKEAEKKLKEYAVELERKNDDMHHFVNATSHDLKSPLRNIASHLQLLERKNTNRLDAESLELITHTVKSVKHLNQLIGDIYQYSVADNNDRPLQKTDMNKLLESTLQQMSDLIEEKHAEVRCNILPVLKVADTHMSMLFTNLISNAIKYNTSPAPRVTVSCEITDEDYIFSVADNGIGIPVEYRKQIFEIFQRLHTSAEYEGTGVGLAICSKIADNYGGKIWVESEPGQGSVFYFNLSKTIADPENDLRILPHNKFAIAS